MKIYTNSGWTDDTRDMLKELEGKDLWVRCWIAELTHIDFGDISGYVYMKVRNVWEEHCDAYVIPIADLTDSDWRDFYDVGDIEYLMTRIQSIPIADIDFDVRNFVTDRYTTEDINDIIGN